MIVSEQEKRAKRERAARVRRINALMGAGLSRDDAEKIERARDEERLNDALRLLRRFIMR